MFRRPAFSHRLVFRLYLSAILFGFGLVLSDAVALRLQSEGLRGERLAELKAMTQVASGIADQFRQRAAAGELTEEQARAAALTSIVSLRYGANDYLFVQSEEGLILGHPNGALVGKPSSVKATIAAAMKAAVQGSAVAEYEFPRVGGTVPMPKVAYLASYKPWRWIVGTGVYIDDLDAVFWSSAQHLVEAGGTVLLLIGVMVVFINRSITRPLARLRRAMATLSAGDTTEAIPCTELRDEVGEMARTVETFRGNAIEKARLEERSDADRQLSEQQRGQTEAEQRSLASQQVKMLESLASALARLSGGDLTCEMTETFAPEYERLRGDYNAAVANLRGVIDDIILNAGAIRSGTGEISQAADDLSRRTEQQAASLEQTAAALDEITATVRKTAEGAVAAKGVVAAAKTEAEHGRIVVGDAVTTMNEIETSAKEIGQIIGVIDEIAFQTNLLALNAGVEAARAGDAGRGFAVVASEVRALAQRSADAAKEIKTLIGASSGHVGRGVTLVRETGEALGRIMGQVTQIDASVSDIAASAQEQASGLAQVNIAVNQMDQVTQQNAAMVEQSTAASHSLAQDTAALDALAARFTTGAKAGAGVRAARTDAAVTRPNRTGPAKPGLTKPGVTKPGSVKVGAVVAGGRREPMRPPVREMAAQALRPTSGLARQLAPAADAWEEF